MYGIVDEMPADGNVLQSQNRLRLDNVDDEECLYGEVNLVDCAETGRTTQSYLTSSGPAEDSNYISPATARNIDCDAARDDIYSAADEMHVAPRDQSNGCGNGYSDHYTASKHAAHHTGYQDGADGQSNNPLYSAAMSRRRGEIYDHAEGAGDDLIGEESHCSADDRVDVTYSNELCGTGNGVSFNCTTVPGRPWHASAREDIYNGTMDMEAGAAHSTELFVTNTTMLSPHSIRVGPGDEQDMYGNSGNDPNSCYELSVASLSCRLPEQNTQDANPCLTKAVALVLSGNRSPSKVSCHSGALSTASRGSILHGAMEPGEGTAVREDIPSDFPVDAIYGDVESLSNSRPVVARSKDDRQSMETPYRPPVAKSPNGAVISPHLNVLSPGYAGHGACEEPLENSQYEIYGWDWDNVYADA